MVRKHQQKIISEDKKITGIFLGTGSGKTRIALLLAVGKTLVICPRTQFLDENWQREKNKLSLSLDLTVISKEKFRKDWELLQRYDTIIIDEVDTMAGVTTTVRWVNKQQVPKTSKLFDSLCKYIKKINPERIYGITATPLRSPMCLWGISIILGKNWSWKEWRDKFYFELPLPGRARVFVPKKDIATKERLGKIVRHLGYVGKISDYVDMPEQVFRTVYVELKDAQKKRIKDIPLEFPDPLIGSMKKHQIENGVLKGDEYNDAEEFPNEKIEKILKYSEEFPRIVIFARYTMQIEQIKKAIEKTGKKVLTLTGKTTLRKELFEEANSSEECVVVAQSSISAGWELPEYPIMIFASMDFQLVSYVQALGRISRLNNPKSNLYVHLVVKKGVDEHVYKTVVDGKMDFHLKMYEE